MTAELEAKETAVAARTNGMPPFKDFLTFVPLLATALAIFYDVGYFYGFDLNYFSFFTLNEHIVFALQVLPYGMLVCALSLPHVLWVFNSKSYENPTFRPGQAIMRDPGQSFSRRLMNAIFIWGIALLWIVGIIYSFKQMPGQYVLSFSTLITGVVSTLYVFGMKRVVIYIVLGAGGLPLLAFAFGLQQANDAEHAAASHIVRSAKGVGKACC
jgi:hypothetical protein